MSLDMFGHIDDTFATVTVTRTTTEPGGYVDGVYIPGNETITTHRYVNIQPVSDREINSLQGGGERIEDARNLYINDGTTTNLTPSDKFEFLGQVWKSIKADNRYWHNKCRVTVVRVDQ